MQPRYEILILTVPEITQDEAKNMETALTNAVQSQKGAIISFERWGKYRLAYPIKKHEYGVYYLVRFEVPRESTAITDIKTLFAIKFNDIVMRSMITQLNSGAPLTYQRPRSLEEAPPARDNMLNSSRDGFGRDRDMRRDRMGEREGYEATMTEAEGNVPEM